MKKIALFSVLLSLVAALFFAACEKDHLASTTDTSAYSNPNNPFDYMGAKHNEGVEILEKYSTSHCQNIVEDAKILADHGMGQLNFKPFEAEFALALSSDDPIKVLSKKRLKEGRMSESLYSALDHLDGIIKSEGYSNQLSQDVIAYENTFPGLALTAPELQALYTATSVARFSNAHWSAKNAEHPADRMKKSTATIGADVIVSVLSGDTDLGLVASVLVWTFWDRVAPGGSGQYGLPWGGGIYGPPCNPGYACPCTIEPGGSDPGPFYMSGYGAAINPDFVFLAMDGSQLDPGFAERFNTGAYQQEIDFTVPEEIVRELYETSGLKLPSGPTVWPAGAKEVLVLDNAWYVNFPVTYEDGTTANWYVMISHGE